MTFILGAVLFLLGGFFGMLIMALGISVRDALPKNDEPILRIVTNNE
jgi:hypothetical protein